MCVESVIDNLKIRKGKDMMKVEICEVVRCYQEDKEMRCKFGNDDECSLQGAVKRMPNSIDENMKAVMEEVIRPLEVAYAKPIRIVEGFVCPRRCNLGGDKRLWLHVKGDTVLIQAVELESHELRFENLEIARAIVKNPRIIIADEPTGNLDSVNTIQVMNIIKTISRDRLVLLVTHEREIAQFYSDRILEMKDGKILSDKINDSSKYLDYQLENRIYLKDMPVAGRFRKDDMTVSVYSDRPWEKGNIKMVLRGGNLFIDTGGKYNVIDETSNIQLIDDHYSAMDESVYQDERFQYDKYMPENFKAKYRSVYTPFNMVAKGFKTVKGFRRLKKLLLLGFVFAAMFTFVATSNVLGVLQIDDNDFMLSDRHYVTVSNPSKTTDLINRVSQMKNSTYVVPGDSTVTIKVPLNDYIQTSMASAALSGSIVRSDMITDKDVKYGRLPAGSGEMAVDKMMIRRYLKAKAGKTAGITSYDQFLNRTVTIPNVGDRVITGITDTGSPSIYVPQDQVMYYIANSPKGQNQLMGDSSAFDVSQGGDQEEAQTGAAASSVISKSAISTPLHGIRRFLSSFTTSNPNCPLYPVTSIFI